MSTVNLETTPLKYRWTAYFDDGTVLKQPEDDRYSKHVDGAEHNPSAFRDILDHEKIAKLIYFDLNDGTFAYGVDLPSGRFGINGTWFGLEPEDAPETKRKLIYYRVVDRDKVINFDTDEEQDKEPVIQAYCFGYEYKDAHGKNVQKVIQIK